MVYVFMCLHVYVFTCLCVYMFMCLHAYMFMVKYEKIKSVLQFSSSPNSLV